MRHLRRLGHLLLVGVMWCGLLLGCDPCPDGDELIESGAYVGLDGVTMMVDREAATVTVVREVDGTMVEEVWTITSATARR